MEAPNILHATNFLKYPKEEQKINLLYLRL